MKENGSGPVISGKDCCACVGPASRDHGHNVFSCPNHECIVVAQTMVNRVVASLRTDAKSELALDLDQFPDIGRRL